MAGKELVEAARAIIVGEKPLDEEAEDRRRDWALRSLLLLNTPLDLGDFSTLILQIDSSRNERLVKWKNEFVTSFLRKLKEAVVAEIPEKDFSIDVHKVIILPHYNAFVMLHNEWTHFTYTLVGKGNISKAMARFFEFVARTSFVLGAPQDQVLAEYSRLYEEKLSKLHLSFVNAGCQLQNNGYKRDDMTIFLEDGSKFHMKSKSIVEARVLTMFNIADASRKIMEKNKPLPLSSPPHWNGGSDAASSPESALPKDIEVMKTPTAQSKASAAALLQSLLKQKLTPVEFVEDDDGIIFTWPGKHLYCDVDPFGEFEVSSASPPQADLIVPFRSQTYSTVSDVCAVVRFFL